MRPVVIPRLLVVAAVCGVGAVASAQTAAPTIARLETPRVARDEQLRIQLPAGTDQNAVLKVLLVNIGGWRSLLGATTVTDPPNGPMHAVATVGADAELGDYTISILVGEYRIAVPGLVTILPVPNAQVHLAELTPPNTYESRTAFVPVGTKDQTESVIVHRVVLPASPRANAVVVDHARVRPEILWAGCDHLPPLPSPEHPADDIQVYGVRSDDGAAVELCRVPVDAVVRVSNETTQTEEKAGSRENAYFSSPKGDWKAVQAFALVLRGSGFQAARPADNRVWLDDVRQRIWWDGCERDDVFGKAGAPQPLRIHGEVVSHEEIRLCGIAVPASSELRVAVGFGDSTKSEVRRFSVFSLDSWAVTWRAALIAIALALVPLGLLMRIGRVARRAGKTYGLLKTLFLDPETNTYSLSKLQFYLWTVAALFGYTYLFISRVRVQNGPLPDVPGTLPGIIAVSAGTAIGSQVVTGVKGSKGSGQEEPSIADFIVSGGVVAADRVQMLVWTFLGVGAFITAIVQLGPGTISDLPAVPEKLLYLMGLSSVGYLGGKMARKAGPVIAEITVSPSDADESIAQATAAVPAPDIAQPILDARAALNGLQRTAATQASLDALQQAINAASGAHTSADFAALLVTLEKQRTAAEAAAGVVVKAEAASPPTATPADASVAQQAAAAIQTLAGATIEAVATASAVQMDALQSPARADRTIDIRGTNLSPDGLLQIDHADLPFRMLTNTQGMHAPELMVRDDTNPTLARTLRLTIVRSALDMVDQLQSDAWFSKRGGHIFTIINPDGQKAEVSFAIPPAEAQKGGMA